MTTVGILGAGSLIGQGIIKSLKHSHLETRTVGLDYFNTAVGLYWTDRSVILPDILAGVVSESEYQGILMEEIKAHGIQVLLVGIDFDLHRLAAARGPIERETGCKVVVSSPDVIEIGDDKWATYKFLEEHGLSRPDSLIDLDGLDDFIDRVGFPLIVKPRRGARSRGVVLAKDRLTLLGSLEQASEALIIQEAVGSEHEEYTAGAMVLDGECTGTIVLKRDLRDGNTHRAYVRAFPELEDMVRRVALLLKPHGPSNFQFRIGEEGPAIFEINARFSGTTVMRSLVGFNEVEAVVRWATTGERPLLTRQRDGVILRYWEEQLVPWSEFTRTGEASSPHV
jgi:carbamoyl-phosphate synthase large subunit